MKKICVTTIYEAINYGAALQALALQSVVVNMRPNAEVCILKYRPSFTTNDIAPIRMHIGTGIKRFGHIFFDILFCVERKKKLAAFAAFADKYFFLSDEIAERDKIIADILISGSDQIWNPYLTDNHVDKVYFSKNTVKGCKRISYASSFGDYDFDDQYAEEIIQAIQGYSYISVREEPVANKLASIIDRDVQTVVDPTLLLTKEQWVQLLDLEQHREQEKYLLLFSVQGYKTTKELITLGKELAKKEKLKIVMIGGEVPMPGIKQIRTASPRDFLELLLNAEAVLTNSFHGTAFSLVFEKPFIVTSNHAGPGRIVSLLEQVGLKEHYYSKGSICKEQVSLDLCAVEYNTVHLLIEKMRKESVDYLEKALGEG